LRPGLTVLLSGIVLLLLATSLFADDGSVEASRDSLPDPASASPVSLVGITRDFGLENQPDFKHSPRTSVLYSTIVPGLGQARNGRWAKASAFVVVGALLVANTLIESDRADRYLHLSRNATSQEEADAYFADYTRHYDARDRMIWWSVGFWVVNMLDAYIDGHLFAFSRQ
jgi:hypothetical protein